MGYGLVLWFVVGVCGLHRKIRLTQLWVELSWVVAIKLIVKSGPGPESPGPKIRIKLNIKSEAKIIGHLKKMG